MKQLLEITNVPVSFELKVHRAKLEVPSDAQKRQNIVNRSYLSTHPTSNMLHMDTYGVRSQMRPRTARVAPISAENSIFASMSATASIAKEGNLLMDIQNNTNTLGDLAFQHAQPTLETQIGIPSVSENSNWDPQHLFTQYEADKLSFEWRTQNKQQLEFTPASVEYVVKEYAHVEIKYMGKPVYVPPPSSPDYEPQLDVIA